MQEEDEKQPESNESDRMAAHSPYSGGYQRGNYQRNNQPYGGSNYSQNRGTYSGGNRPPNDRPYSTNRTGYSDRQPRQGTANEPRPYSNRSYDNRPPGNRVYPPRQEGYTPNRPYDNRPYDNNRSGGHRRDSGTNDRRDPRAGNERRHQSERGGRDKYAGKSHKQKNEPLQPKPKVRTVTLVKALTRLDYGSPKKCLDLIQSGKVFVNDVLAKDHTVPIIPYKEKIVADGIVIQQKQKNVYIIMHKPKGISGSFEKSNSIFQMLQHDKGWFFPIGCLDKASNGIVIITNDPSHKNAETSPFKLLEKEYWVKVHKVLTPKQIAQLELALGKELKENIKIDLASANTRNTVISISVCNSTPSAIRTALKKNDLETMTFERRRFASLITTENLRSGSWRQLNVQEIRELMGDAVEMQEFVPPIDQPSSASKKSKDDKTESATPISKWQKLKKQLLGGK
jgi:pseudouridine synthase